MNEETNRGDGSSSRLDRIEATLQQLAELSLKNEFNLVAYRKASDERLSKHAQEIADIRASQARTQTMLEHLTKVVGGIGDNTIALENFRGRVAEAARVQPDDYEHR